MKLSMARKVYLAILAAAAAALLADRLLVGYDETPEQARASVGPSRPGAPAAAERPTSSPVGAAGPSGPASLADRLKKAAGEAGLDPDSAADAFAPSELWLAQPEEAQAGKNLPTPGEVFATGHRLSSVVLAGEGGWAIVNGKIVRLGERIDGFDLVELTRSSAVFQAGQERVELKLPAEAAR